MTTERAIIAILVAFILGVLFTATSVGGTVLEPIRGVVRPSASPGPAPVTMTTRPSQIPIVLVSYNRSRMVTFA